ncbi:MAG: two-component system sensor histidine kinase CreC [Verrucomicrobiales bacterium]|nr:two-component system sensor histidine kinase CreC [Verrucomicrobiales bacterium]
MRITLLIVAGFLAIAGSGFFWLMKTISDDIERQYSQASEEPLVDFAHLFAALLEQDISGGKIDVTDFRSGFTNAYRREFLAKIYQIRKTEIHTHVYVTDETGTVIFDSDDGKREGEDYSKYNDVYLARAGDYGVRSTRTDPKDSRTSVFYIAAPLYSQEKLIGTLTVFRPETAMAPFAEESRNLVFRASLITAGLVFFLGSIWAYLVLHPIRKLTKHAQRITEGKQATLPPTGMGELRVLSIALENMRKEIEGKHYVENYVQALTHELKSPLAAIRGAAELIDEKMPEEKRRRFLQNILTETDRSENMVRRLVQLASVESRTQLEKREIIDLGNLVTEEIAGLSASIETKKIEVGRETTDQAMIVEGDPLMLRIAIRNALTNAIDFSPENGEIAISLSKEKAQINLSIKDDGPGIPDYAGDRVFDRFYSLKNEITGRKGSGIGLSFVRATMQLHNGRAELANHEGGGAEMILIFCGDTPGK